MTRLWTLFSLVVLVVPGIPAFAGIDEAVEPELPIVPGQGLAALLPEETVIFASVRDVPTLLEKLKALPLGKVVLREGFLEDLLPPEAFDQVREFYEKFVKPVGAILRGEVAFGVVEIDVLDGEPPAMVVLADVAGKEDALAAYLEGTFLPWLDASEELTRTEETIGGADFTVIVDDFLEERAGALGVKGGVCVLIPRWFDFEAVVEMVDNPPRRSLATNPWFAEVERALPGADVIGYINLGAIDRQVRVYLVDEEDVEEDYQAGWGVFHAISGFDCVEAAGIGMTFGPGDGSTTICAFGRGFYGGVTGALTCGAPLKSVRYVGDDACFCLAFSLGSLSQVYKDTVATVAECCEALGGDPDEVWWFHESVEVIEELLGRDLAREVLPALGGEVAVAAWIPSGLDVPPGALMIEVKDEEAVVDIVEDMLAAVIEAGGGEIGMDESWYEGVEIISLDGVPFVIPAVAFVGDFLVVATNPSVIEDMIDTLAEGPHLGEAEGYKRYVASMPGDAAVTLYLDAKRIFEFGWPFAVAMMGEDPEAAGPLKAIGELGQALSPLGVKVFGNEEGITVTSRSANGGLGTASFLAAVMTVSTVTVEARAAGPADIDFGRPEGFEPQVVDHEEAEEVEVEIEPEGE